MNDIIFFSNNSKKIEEIISILSNLNFNILNLNLLSKTTSPDEDGLTFKENAKIKSLYGLRKFNKICFADDSGICIKAMNNNPGIHSKRYIESEVNKNIVLKKIILETKKKNIFSAYFQTTICLSLSENEHLYFVGKINGNISNEIKGRNGFGYDPIFIPKGFKKTFAEMTSSEKNLSSHRFIATNKLKKFLQSKF